MASKMKRFLSLTLAVLMLISLLPATALAADEEASVNLVPIQAPESTANYVCTWNIQDWVAWHEGNGNNSTKRDIVDPDHIFGNEEKGITGWADLLYKQARSDMLFLLDDGWDLPYGTTNKNAAEFGSMVLPTDKFPVDEWGATPQERLKTLNDKMKDLGWAGTGLWICAQESKAYTEYYCNGNVEEYWKMRMEWCKYAGIAYWKVDWGNRMGDITWQNNLEKWAEEVYPELIIEHATGGTGGKSTDGNKRLNQDKVQSAVEYAAFSDVYRTYDVLDNLMTCITLDRVGEQLLAGYTQAETEESSAMGLLNSEDEMYIAASLGLTMGVMRFDPDLAKDVKNSGDEYFGQGTEANSYYSGGKAFTDTRATRTSLDEVTRAVMWQRIAPAYAMGDYDVELSHAYLDDSWRFRSGEKAWDGTGGTLTQRAPAAIARGIDLPTVTTSDGADIPYLTASRNPNGAISIATHARTYAEEGYIPIKTADVVLNAGDLTGKIGVFGYYGSLSMTFNQDLTGKTVLAQDLMATEAEDITDRVTIDGSTITIDGELLAEIGLSAATEGDTSLPGLVIQIGDEADFVAAAETNERLDSWDVNNGSFERFSYDANNGETMKSVTGADWSRSGTNAASYITEGGHTGDYAATHTSASAYSVTTYQLNKAVPSGVYKVSAWVKASANAGAQLQVTNTGSGTKSVDIPAADDWTQVTIDEVRVINGQIQVQVVSSNAAAGSYVIFDDVEVEWVKVLDETKIEANEILNFDFDDEDVVTDAEGNVTGVKGTALNANGKVEVTAEVVGVTFEDGVAVYKDDNFAPSLRNTVGIKYVPNDAAVDEMDPVEDPLKALDAGSGVTVNMWINTNKTASENVCSSLFVYGEKQDNGELGASAQLLEVPSTTTAVYYRNQSGSSENYKFGASGNVYKTGQWQLVSLVDDGTGSVQLYVDGVLVGSRSESKPQKSISGFAHDGYAPDAYYFGYVDYLDSGTSTDAHFEGQIDEISIYDGVLTGAQIQNLYNAYFAPQTEIILEVADGTLGGQAVMNEGYVGWIGHGSDAKGDEGTVTFTFDCKKADEWQMDVYYLSKTSTTGMANNRAFEVTVNGDTENVLYFACPDGQSWNDPNLASVYTVKSISLNKGENTLKIGNSKDNAPSLVRVVLTSKDGVDTNEAAEVEQMIMSKLSIVDNFEQLEAVQECRAAYDALTEAQKALVSEEAYAKLTDAEELMDQWQAVAVANKIEAIGEVTSLEQKAAVEAARAAYEELTDAQKALVDEASVKKLEAAEAKIGELENSEPEPTEPQPTEPQPTEPQPTEPQPTEPQPTEPQPTEPQPTEPQPTEPQPTEPQPTEPQPTEPVEHECSIAGFKDVNLNAWYHEALDYMVSNGYMNGKSDTVMDPDGQLTRAELVKILYEIAGAPAVDDLAEPFMDVSEDQWFYNAIVWAFNEEVVTGTSDTTFSPDSKITREQLATILYRYDDEPEVTGNLDAFKDAGRVNDYAVDAMTWAVETGVITGITPDTLAPRPVNESNPKDTVGLATRAQAATMLMRYLEK